MTISKEANTPKEDDAYAEITQTMIIEKMVNNWQEGGIIEPTYMKEIKNMLSKQETINTGLAALEIITKKLKSTESLAVVSEVMLNIVHILTTTVNDHKQKMNKVEQKEAKELVENLVHKVKKITKLNVANLTKTEKIAILDGVSKFTAFFRGWAKSKSDVNRLVTREKEDTLSKVEAIKQGLSSWIKPTTLTVQEQPNVVPQKVQL